MSERGGQLPTPSIPAAGTDALRGDLLRIIDRKTKPPGSLGRLEEIALQLGAIQNSTAPEIVNPAIVVFAGDHGAATRGLSPYPQEVTAQMVLNFVGGGAAINAFARTHDARLLVVDAGVVSDFDSALRLPITELDAPALVRLNSADGDPERGRQTKIIDAKVCAGTRSYFEGDALSAGELSECFERGTAIVRALAGNGCNTIGFGEMGIGNTSAASLLQSVLTGREIAACVGRGTGHDDAGLARKQSLLAEALAAYRARPAAELLFSLPDKPAIYPAGLRTTAVRAPHSRESKDSPEVRRARALDALAAFGGAEIAMMCGAMLAAGAERMCVLVDGYICTAAAIAALEIEPLLRDYLCFAHVSGEQGHAAMLEWLEVRPLLQLELRLGEGTGAAIALPLLRSAAAFVREMASFADAGVSDREE